jgi:XTP/dITP diphosphohydrolase
MRKYINTINENKRIEIKKIFTDLSLEVDFFQYPIEEILSEKLNEVIIKKSSMAYEKCHVPVIVEHGALQIDYLNGLPGALSKPIWDILDGKICDMIPAGLSRKAKACSAVCYCDGKNRYYVIECTEGTISKEPMGTNGFQWDPIFIPDGSDKTYAEMELIEKLKFSQAKKAYLKLIEYLKN